MISTRKKDKCSLSDAILKGLALDGGLFVGESFPFINDFEELLKGKNTDDYSSCLYKELAYKTLSPFFKGDEIEDSLLHIIDEAFNFPCPLVSSIDKKAYLELYKGPTAAFKDFGARFLAYSMEAILKKRGKNLTILVATSGDTGSAVASAFYKRDGIKVKILFPKGGVSERQKKLLTVWGENIESYEVDGTFDDCQKMVKDAFQNEELTKKYALTSANSINIGRLLPQMTYYVYSSLVYKSRFKKEPIIIIPTGNVGNATACFYAKKIGAPIKRIVFAENANRPLVDYFKSGVYTPRPSIKTYANAMDVGAPSNMERLLNLYPDFATFSKETEAYSVVDDEILKTIKSTYEEENRIICPHTATAKKVYDEHYKGENAIIVSTADPAKFENVIKKAIGLTPSLPESLTLLLSKEEKYKNISKNYMELF